MDNPGDYLVYQYMYSDPDRDTNNGLVFEFLHEATSYQPCPNCGEQVVVTHGKLARGYIEIKECTACDYEETDTSFSGCEDCGS